MAEEKCFESVEIIIVSYNRMEILAETLGLLRRLYPSTPLCLGIQGEKPSKEFTNLFIFNQPTRLVHFQEPSITRTLNTCIQSSEAEICLLLDDDACPCPGWLEEHLKAYSENSLLPYTVGREIRTTKCRFFVDELINYLVETVHRFFVPPEAILCGRIVGWVFETGFVFGNFNLPGQAAINSARGCNMSVRREWFQKNGGFNENFRGNSWGFETEFGKRTQKAGKLGKYIGQAVVLHHETMTGGTRASAGEVYIRDFEHNQNLLKKELGRWAVLGNNLRSLLLRKKTKKLIK